MFLIAIAFLCGDIFLQSFTKLPSLLWLVVCFVFLLLFFMRNNTCYVICAFVCGFSCALYQAHERLNALLPSEFECKDVYIRGTITSLPINNGHSIAFLYKSKKFKNGLLKLSWHTKQELHVGDVWEFHVKLKRIHSLLNPGGFDYSAHALTENIIAQGYVINKQHSKLLKNEWYFYPINTLREKIHNKLQSLLPKTDTSPWIEALLLGERHGIDGSKWGVLRATGTNHLMAIAGLHIGFVSGLIAWITLFFANRIPNLNLYIPAQILSAIAALFAALIYSALAGFSLPTQRACIMLSVFLTGILLQRNVNSWHAWSLAILIIIIANPFSVLSESFWLSFGSVALIIYGMSGRIYPKGLWWKWGRIQYVIAIGLFPLSILLFHQFSLIGFLANTIAIPWITFLIIPFCLIACVFMLISEYCAKMLLQIADYLLHYLWIILDKFAHLSFSSYYQNIPNQWMFISACMGIVLLLVPKGFPGRLLGITGLLPVIFFQPNLPKMGEVWFTQLDVGQGLATVVQTNQHLLIFDTGAHLGNNYDMGESVVIPFLRFTHAKKIDAVVISHGDNDHIGGLNAVLKSFSTDKIMTSVPSLIANANYCLQGQKWQWDGVQFEFLYPTLKTLGLDNDSSCVLRVSNQTKSILLTGDIEKFAEKELLRSYPNLLHADILAAPHHGSKTSGLKEFIDAVNPAYVIYSTGYRNRFHFPNKSVVETYFLHHIKQINTVDNGAIQIKIKKSGFINLESYRWMHDHYWYDQASKSSKN